MLSVQATLLAVSTGKAVGQPQRVQQHSTDASYGVQKKVALPDDLNEDHNK